MGVSRIDYDNETLIDLSNDTVTPQTLAKGFTAHNSNGDKIVGTMTSEDAPSSGSGIIDVTELPTSGIDENAVYRLTESVQTEKTEVYILAGTLFTFQEYLTFLGIPTIPNIYVVDELSNMLETDVQTFSAIHIYILRSDGIAYANIPAYGGIITLGLFGFQAMGYDKGTTDDIYAETENGVYTIIETFKEVARYFIRENSEWKEITAYSESQLPNGLKGVEFLQGKYVVGDPIEVKEDVAEIDIADVIFNDKIIPSKIKVNTPCIADLIKADTYSEAGMNQTLTHIPMEWFRQTDGTYIERIRKYAFAECTAVKTVDFPAGLTHIFESAFNRCVNLESINFSNTLKYIGTKAFYGCYYLPSLILPESIELLSSNAFGNCSNLATVTFKGTPNEIYSDAFSGCHWLTTITVPWSEGEVANAPWGAYNATINYDNGKIVVNPDPDTPPPFEPDEPPVVPPVAPDSPTDYSEE